LGQLLLYLREDAVGVGIGFPLDNLLLLDGTLALGVPILLRLTLDLLYFCQHIGAELITVGLGLGLELAGNLLGLLDNAHFIQNLGGLGFGGLNQILGVAICFGQQTISLLQDLYCLPKGGGQIQANGIELVEQGILIDQGTATKRHSRATQNDLF
jgi:hypothetical protein